MLLWTWVFMYHCGLKLLTLSGRYLRRGIAGSNGTSSFSFLRNSYIDFQRGCNSLHAYQQWRSVPFPLTTTPAFVIGWFLHEMESQCFNLHFSNDQGCWTFFAYIYLLFVLLHLRDVYSFQMIIFGLRL